MAKTPLTVTVITDTHYYSKKTGTKGKAYDAANAKSQKLLKYSEELLRAAFKQIKEDKRTDIVLLSGDTTNNGEIEAHEEFIEMLRDLKKSGKRVYVLTATHDYQDDGLTDSFVGNEKVKIPAAKREQLYDMYKEFGPDEAIAVHRDSMSYVVQLADGYRLFALNDDSNLSGKSGFSDECFEWIKAQAEDARKNDQFILAMTHHPLIAPSPIYELIGKNDMLGDYETRRNELADENRELKEKIEELLSEIKQKDIDRVVFKNEQLYRYFPSYYTAEQMKREILTLLKINMTFE